MASPTEENYLKTLFTRADKNGEIAITDLSHHLKVSAPTANSMIKNLSQQGLVHYEKYKLISLTAKGKKEAAFIIRKHRLTEMYLVEKMGFGWEMVHEIAEQIEHINSPHFFDRMDELLGYPKVDPHGSPIPDKNGKITPKALIKLSDCKVGDSVTLCALANSSEEFLKYLNSKQLQLDIKLRIETIEPFDQSMRIKYLRNRIEVMSQVACNNLLVEKHA
ncbi:MAG: metal-dependent transcriptional regulator [Cyclobacteriaceae bacterium]|nr:metal-dependent transcriptional regulator [Cyclobacteriaceae bacterium]